MKLDLLYPAALLAVGLLYVASAKAGPPASYIRNDVHPTAISGAAAKADADATGIGVGVGGAGGVGGTGGSVSAPTTVTTTTEVKSRAFGGGSTGLTGNARCLQSFGFAFNAVSATYTDKNCLAMEVAEEHCADKACKKEVACSNPDVPDYAKKAIGCTTQR